MVIVGINQDPYWDEEHVNYTVWLETNPAPICSKSEFKKTLVTTKKAKQCFYFNLRYNLWAWLWSNLSESTYAALPGHCAKLGRVNDKVVILSIKYCGKRFPDRSLLRCFLIPAGSPEGSKRNSLRGDEILRELKVTSLYHSFRESKLTQHSESHDHLQKVWDSLIWQHGSKTIIKGWEDSSTRRPHSDPSLSYNHFSGVLILSVLSLPFGREVLKQQNTKWHCSPFH